MDALWQKLDCCWVLRKYTQALFLIKVPSNEDQPCTYLNADESEQKIIINIYEADNCMNWYWMKHTHLTETDKHNYLISDAVYLWKILSICTETADSFQWHTLIEKVFDVCKSLCTYTIVIIQTGIVARNSKNQLKLDLDQEKLWWNSSKTSMCS